MVAAKKVDMRRVLNFEAEKKHDGLKGVVPTIDKITDENKSAIGCIANWVSLIVPILNSLSTS